MVSCQLGSLGISKRNQTWLAQNPVHRDPQMFNATEVEMGPAAREMTYKMQKWNVRSERVHPILVANTRVDWLALDDAEISRNFPILLEGILQDVLPPRASSAWQGAQPQRVTVSLLLAGSSTAEQWRLSTVQTSILAYHDYTPCLLGANMRRYTTTRTSSNAIKAPVRFGVNRLEGLVAGYLMELMATHSNASLCRKRISDYERVVILLLHQLPMLGSKLCLNQKCK